MNGRARTRLERVERILRPPHPLPEIVVRFVAPGGIVQGERRIRMEPLPGPA